MTNGTKLRAFMNNISFAALKKYNARTATGER